MDRKRNELLKEAQRAQKQWVLSQLRDYDPDGSWGRLGGSVDALIELDILREVLEQMKDWQCGDCGAMYYSYLDFKYHKEAFHGVPVNTDNSIATKRKRQPLASGVLDYFPDALLAVAECSRIGNDQHNPGQPLHWAKEKSTDEADALLRHMIDRGRLDTDGVRHSAKVAWRALAMLQRELEAERAK